MRSNRFFKDTPGNFMRGAQALFLFVPLAWGLSDAAKGDSNNALLKLMWFMFMLGSYINGYLLGDSNKKECRQQHFRPHCELPHFPENVKFSDNQLPVEIPANSNMAKYLAEKDKEMKLENKREMDKHKRREIEPGWQEEGREDSQKLRM